VTHVRAFLIASARHVASILLLPFVVVVIVPTWLLTSLADLDYRWSGGAFDVVGGVLGILIFVAGLLLFIWCVALFARVGRGTLAPWDPTQRLVAVGPYRHVRNPMISAVSAMLTGEAFYFGSAILTGWTLLFITINQIYFLVSEEPGLERRFGAAYVEYKRSVPRWLPRVK
jgi:protein-S-isoprenylcysteine O-methyltransferase Ste14